MRKRNLPAIVAALITIGCITTSAQTVTTLHSFNGSDGQAHSEGMAFKINAAGALTTLHSFSGFPTDGALPVAGLLPTNLSIFFGTTASGGMFFQGTVFGMTSGVTVMLHSFNSFLGEGAVPTAGLVRGSDGNFYGTTVSGGAHYLGTVFKMTPIGTLTTLHSFSGSPSDGAVPVAALVQGTDGNFYGTTTYGGEHSQGTVFRITSADAFTVLHSFSGPPSEGAVPFAGLVQGTDGYFYGTTALGGANSEGTVFKLSSSSSSNN
jgi:uncharacterized repeat protein (TIGR03803 family)